MSRANDVSTNAAAVTGNRAATVPWIKRYKPERNMGEVGVFGGVYMPSTAHELFETDRALPDQGFRKLDRVRADVGLRLGYYPLSFLGIEAEGAVMPGKTADKQTATIWSVRGQLLGQLPFWSVVPFALLGVNGTGVVSDRSALGNDVDLGLHVGGGVKAFVHRNVALRLDARDVIAAKRGVEKGVAHNGEVLLGVSFTFGRKRSKPQDTDGDGFVDLRDECPLDPGVAPVGCPPEDRDGDGFLDNVDACPDEPGVAPDGCPLLDRDHDGIVDNNDACPDDPETVNGFDDDDGCPDDVPAAVTAFTGTIEGITFDLDSDNIRPSSFKTLNDAVNVLREHPSVSVEIVGHTDTTGTRTYSLGLSLRRARAGRTDFVAAGVDESRLQTRGAGPDEPVASNRTAQGRTQNRRIEFRLVHR